MKKIIVRSLFAAFATLVLVSSIAFSNGFADEEGMSPAQEPSQEDRGLERVPPGKTWDEAWRGFFGRDLPDPLADPGMSPDEWQRQREQADRHAQAGAQFTEAATSVVTAGMPSPTAAAGAATQVISETAQGAAEAGSTPPPAQPTAWQRFCRWVASWFE